MTLDTPAHLTKPFRLCFASPITHHPQHRNIVRVVSPQHLDLPNAPRVTLKANLNTSDSTTPVPMASLPPGVDRKSIRFVAPDIVTISDPELICAISSRSDIGRPAASKLPFLFRTFFYATKFYYPPDDEWASALQTDGENDQPKRRQNAFDSLERGFSQDQVNRIEALIKGNDDFPTLGLECAKIVAKVILPLKEGEELPDEIAKASFDTLTEFNQTFNIVKYLQARKARAATEEYIRNLLPNEQYPGDVVHNLGAAAQGFSKAIEVLQGKVTEEVVPTLSKDAMVKGVLRVPLTRTTLDGIFPEDNPLLPDRTLIIMDIGAAAAKTQDDNFLFGVGLENRQCPFKDIFLSTTKEIRSKNVSTE